MAIKQKELVMTLDDQKNVPRNLPVMSFDPIDRLIRNIKRYDPSFTMENLRQIFNYPTASDIELVKIYLFGGGRPFIDFLVYISLGVGWTYEAKGFDDEEKGREAVRLAEEFTDKIHLKRTMNRFGTFYEVLGRACLIKTRALSGDFYQNEAADITGVDCINPMTLTDRSIMDVNADKTGTETYQQLDADGTPSEFTQDRVYYRTQNNLSGEKSLVGISRLQSCIADFRALAEFPKYRSKLGRLYSEITQVITIDTSKMEGPLKDKLMESNKEAQNFLDETAEYYRKLASQGSIAAAFDWFEIVNTTFAGKEVKLDVVEDKTLASIGRNMGVPVPLLDSSAANILNRSSLEAIRDTNVAMEEKGTRNIIHKPIIEEIINEFIETQGITQGRLECKFNPFLSDNLLEAAQIISLVWQTNAISRPEVRPRIGLPPEIDTGGKEWKDLDIDAMPDVVKAATAVIPSLKNDNNGPVPDGNQNSNKPPETAEQAQRLKDIKKTLLDKYPDLIKVIQNG